MAVVFLLLLLLLDATMRPARNSGQLLMSLIDSMKVLRGGWRKRFEGHGDHEGHTCCYSFKVSLGSLQTGAGGSRRRNAGTLRQTHSCAVWSWCGGGGAGRG